MSQDTQSEPHIYVLCHTDATRSDQYLIIGEKNCIAEATSCIGSILNLIACYYAFDISYPKSLQAILLFFQKTVFNIGDNNLVLPSSLCSLISSLNSV